MMTPKRITVLVLVLLAAAVVALFTWTNHATTVNLLFKLSPSLAWDLGPDGVALPALLGIAFLGGAVLAGIVGSLSVMDSGRRVKILGRQVTALQDEIEFNKRSDAKTAASTSSASDVDDLI